MRRTILLASLALVLAIMVAAVVFKPVTLLRIASGSVSQNICSKTFVTGLPPDQIFAEDLRPEPGMGLIAWALHYDVNRTRRDVRTTIAGLFESISKYRDGYGCVLVHPGDERPAPLAPTKDPAAQSLPAIAGPELVVTTNPRLQAAIDQGFAERENALPRVTHAIVVVQHGHVAAERYAPGYGIDTPLLSHSIAKSVMNALAGILTRQGKLDVMAPAPIAAWQNAQDPRHAVTTDQLLRMSSGLDFDEGIGPGPSQQMWFVEPSTAAFAEQSTLVAPPGTAWGYSNHGYALLSRIVGKAIGGDEAAIANFAERELFAPLGMRHAVMEFDAAGIPAGSNAMFATAREWAQFGLLYLNDGVVGGRRILPEGWVAYSTQQTGNAGYGAGFWLNTVDTQIARWGTHWGIPGAPRDAYMARGYLGQYVIVIPSEDLVIVRFGASHIRAGDIEGTGALVRDVVAALH